MARYEAGETLASIARTYDCSPPAISYVVSRGRAKRPADAAPPAPTPNPAAAQLIKATVADSSANGNGKPPDGEAATGNGEARMMPPPGQQPSITPAAPVAADDRRDQAWARRSNGFAENGNGERGAAMVSRAPQWQRPAEPAGHPNGEQRRTLHLSLGNSSPNSSAATTSDAASPVTQPLVARQPGNGAAERADGFRPEAGFPPPPPAAGNGGAQHANGDGAARKDGGSFIDKELRARVDGDIAAFLAAFDAALVDDTQESRLALRDATDRLLRAGARTRIELERLEARIPLPPRAGERAEPVWRPR